MSRLMPLLTSDAYQGHVRFWHQATAPLQDDFVFRQTWLSLPAGDEPCSHRVTLKRDTCDLLERLSKGSDLGACVVATAGLQLALAMMARTHSVIVDMPLLSAGSKTAHTDHLPLALPAMTPQSSLRTLLGDLKDSVAQAFNFQDFPVDEYQTLKLGRSRATRTNVAFQMPAIHRSLDLQKYDLVVTLQRENGWSFSLEGADGWAHPSFLMAFGNCLGVVFNQFADLDAQVVDLAPAQDFDPALEPFQVAHCDLDTDRSIAAVFAQIVQQHGSKVAVVYEDQSLTYRELDRLSTNLAVHLRRDLGLPTGRVIAGVAGRSPWFVVGLLATLKAGGSYLCLDPTFPTERLAFMLEDAGAGALLLHSEYIHQMSDFYHIPMVALDLQCEELEAATADNLPLVPSQLPAYIIYTSGSTGKPKGVSVPQRALLNNILHHIDYLNIKADDAFSQFYNTAFDSSMFEVFMPLLSGAKLVLVPRETVADPAAFGAYISQHGVTVTTLPPIYLAGLGQNALAGVHTVITAGDVARLEHAARMAPHQTYCNSYGPTETAICISHYLFRAGERHGVRMPIGRPVRNNRIYIVDQQMRALPPGMVGQIAIAGDNLAHGYLGRPQTTAQAFVPNPFEATSRMYLTGDLGTWLPDGQLEMLGRADYQVKIRGFRVELGEIEAALARHNAVTETVVTVWEPREGDKRLVAYIASASEVDEQTLRTFLGERLPDFMIPSGFQFLETIPRTASGKVDHKALPDPAQSHASQQQAGGEPRDEVEKALCQVWAETLGVPQIGIRDNFFEMGGDSILTIQMVSKAAQAGLKLQPKQLFEHPTIEALAPLVEQQAKPQAEQGQATGTVPLTPIQRWFFEQADDLNSNHYNQSIVLQGQFDTELLAQAMAHLHRHHDALNLRFQVEQGQWQQSYGEAPTSFDVALWQAGTPEQPSQIDFTAQLQSGMDLQNGPLMRMGILREPSQDTLIWTAHHAVVDGISWRILVEDLHTIYKALQQGQTPQLPPKTSSYQAWARKLETYQVPEEQVAYWTDPERSHAQPLKGNRRGSNRIADTANEHFALDQNTTQNLLKDAHRAYNTHINDLLLSALISALHQWSGNTRFLVDLEGHGREDLFADLDLSRTVGWFTALTPCSLSLPQAHDPASLIKHTKEQLRQVPARGFGHSLLRYLKPQSETAQHLAAMPAADIVFNYLGQADNTHNNQLGWQLSDRNPGPEQDPQNHRSHLLEINAIVRAGQLHVTMTYSHQIHSVEDILQFSRQFQQQLEQLVAHCLNPDSRGFTPSDFPALQVNQSGLDNLMAKLNKN